MSVRTCGADLILTTLHLCSGLHMQEIVCLYGVNQSITARKLNDTLTTLNCADMSEHMYGLYGQFITK